MLSDIFLEDTEKTPIDSVICEGFPAIFDFTMFSQGIVLMSAKQDYLDNRKQLSQQPESICH